MNDRNVIVDRENGNALAAYSLIAVVVVAALIGLFIWQPWNGAPAARTAAAASAER
jgi:predicted negative regulator of RcsB-dependent stress response